ncbi:MAG TPA: tRNA pseudouridine(55) synthase TruB [Chloroflexota bacterium]|nr:tRNA pseudouridine(55) synthase TruB [Chloroflexota bacterium]
MTANSPELHGFFNVDKPSGPTSHDLVAQVRRAGGQLKVGHAGTLDPFASGVLVICVGRGTRLAEEITPGRKRYRAGIILGVETDTYDRDGQVVARQPVSTTRSQVETVAASLLGAFKQIPPMYSAIKVGGRKLYEIARSGATVERAAREVEIYRLDVLDWTPPRILVDIECSKGTYVRSIAHDIGVTLGTGGHLDELIRTGSGDFRLADSVSLEQLVEDLRQGTGARWLIPLDHPVTYLPAIVLDQDQLRVFTTGQVLRDIDDPTPGRPRARVYGSDGWLKGLAERVSTGWTPSKVFA